MSQTRTPPRLSAWRDRLDARALRDLVLDPGSWRSWDSPVPARDVTEDYARELAAAAERRPRRGAAPTLRPWPT